MGTHLRLHHAYFFPAKKFINAHCRPFRKVYTERPGAGDDNASTPIPTAAVSDSQSTTYPWYFGMISTDNLASQKYNPIVNELGLD